MSMLCSIHWSFTIVSVVDEQNRHTQVQRMSSSSSSSIKRENSEELKDGEDGELSVILLWTQHKDHFGDQFIMELFIC